MKCILVNDYEKKVIDIEKDLNTYYELLKCDCIDIQERYIINDDFKKIGRFNFILDDEGLFKDNNFVSCVNERQRERFVGNVLICGIGEYGNETDLTNEDIKEILFNCNLQEIDFSRGRLRPILKIEY